MKNKALIIGLSPILLITSIIGCVFGFCLISSSLFGKYLQSIDEQTALRMTALPKIGQNVDNSQLEYIEYAMPPINLNDKAQFSAKKRLLDATDNYQVTTFGLGKPSYTISILTNRDWDPFEYSTTETQMGLSIYIKFKSWFENLSVHYIPKYDFYALGSCRDSINIPHTSIDSVDYSGEVNINGETWYRNIMQGEDYEHGEKLHIIIQCLDRPDARIVYILQTYCQDSTGFTYNSSFIWERDESTLMKLVNDIYVSNLPTNW